jgi:hypothetical protein
MLPRQANGGYSGRDARFEGLPWPLRARGFWELYK